MKKYIILFLSLSFFPIGYSSEASLVGSFNEIYFEVNDSLLSQPIVIDDNFQISIPKELKLGSKEIIHKLKKSIDSDTSSYFPARLINVFNDDDVLIVFSKVIKNVDIFKELNSEYYDALVKTFETKDIINGTFKINGIKTFQHIISKKNHKIIKLFIFNYEEFYEISYIININIYQDYLKKIESSLGSIKSINKFEKED